MRDRIAALGAGRMGRGIAIVFAYAGHEVALIDFKPREAAAFDALAAEALAEIRGTLALLASFGLFDAADVDRIAGRVTVAAEADAATALGAADIVFEGVPEILDVKREALNRASVEMAPGAILASTTSTILVDDLSSAVVGPERFLNAHWLNPAYLVPLVEVSPGAVTEQAVTDRLIALLTGIGKKPVLCAASPGFIVPRIQALAMNEAARMVEEGVASPEAIDEALTYGFGFRFSVLGVLEFIDWGGGDILYHASNYLSDALENDRYKAPDIINANMQDGKIGLKTGEGFLNYEGRDLDAYRRDRLAGFVDRLKAFGLAHPPKLD